MNLNFLCIFLLAVCPVILKAQNTVWPGTADNLGVGIGTTTPRTRLEIAPPSNTTAPAGIFRLSGSQAWGHVLTLATDAGAYDDGRLLFSYRDRAKQWSIGGSFNTTRFGIWEDGGDGIFGQGFGTERLTVLPGGNVGIGTSSPLGKLDVDITTNTERKSISIFTNTGVNAVNAPIGGIRFNWYGNNNAEIQMVRGYGATDGAGLSFLTSGEGGVAIERMRVDKNGNVGIGTSDPQAKLAVNGLIRSREVKVETANFPDYVFKPTYRLQSLSDVKSYIDKNHHLPGVPSEKEVVRDGLNLGEMNKVLLKKVEELTLYLIQQNKQLEIQKTINLDLQNRLKSLEIQQANQTAK